MAKNVPDFCVWIEAEGLIENMNANKEGTGPDGSPGLTLKLSCSVRTDNAHLMLGSLRGAEEMDKFLWDAKKGTLRIHGIGAIPSTLNFGANGGCRFEAFGVKEEAVMKKIFLRPQSVPGCWDLVCNIYIRDPSDEMVLGTFHDQKARTSFKFIQSEPESFNDDEEQAEMNL